MLLAARFSKSPAAGQLLMDIRGQITATFRTFAFCRRNSTAHFTVAFRALHCPPNGRVYILLKT